MHPYYPSILSIVIIHRYQPCILSVDIIHGYYPSMLSISIIHGYHPLISSIDKIYGYHSWDPMGGTMGSRGRTMSAPEVGSLSLLGLRGPLGLLDPWASLDPRASWHPREPRVQGSWRGLWRVPWGPIGCYVSSMRLCNYIINLLYSFCCNWVTAKITLLIRRSIFAVQ